MNDWQLVSRAEHPLSQEEIPEPLRDNPLNVMTLKVFAAKIHAGPFRNLDVFCVDGYGEVSCQISNVQLLKILAVPSLVSRGDRGSFSAVASVTDLWPSEREENGSDRPKAPSLLVVNLEGLPLEIDEFPPEAAKIGMWLSFDIDELTVWFGKE